MADAPFQRSTRQRRVILEELSALKSHPTASELYEVVRKRLPRISLGTVYRNLELMHKAGMVLKLAYGSESRFDADVREHHHVRCVHCDRVADLYEVPVQPPRLKAEHPLGYEILGYQLEFIGVCPDCLENEADLPRAPMKASR
jgi:Fur family transcriptional regulator, ferric uptake regulator